MSAGWGFSEETNVSTTIADWGFETDVPGTSALCYTELEVQIVKSRNRARRIMTTMPEFTTHLAQAGLEGPYNVILPGLDKSPWATKIGAGAQFTVFSDDRSPEKDKVIKRVNVFDTYSDQQQKRDNDPNFRKQLYTIETEILALCHPPLRKHRNIVTVFAWGYDYRDDSDSPAVPILYMERALCALSNFIHDGLKNHASVPKDIIGYQLCLDVAEGLAAMHKSSIVHGDIKPDNILIFPQDNPRVPYIAKLSDFGVCVALQGQGAPVDFTAYRGTPGWRPPEAAKYEEELHGKFTPDLLFRSDSFSYGLLVLSVLVTGGRPPLSKSLESAAQSPYSLLSYVAISILQGTSKPSEQTATGGQKKFNPLEDAIAIIGRATHVRGTLRAQVRSLLGRVLQVRPGERDLVDSSLLADDEEVGYIDWRRQNNLLQSPLKPSYRGQTWQRGAKYWLDMEQKLLRELDIRYNSLLKKGEDLDFPGETLHGMAIAYLWSENGKASYQENIDKALMYMTASAQEGFHVAQGICERLHRSLGRKPPDSIDEATRSQWLYNAASSGSLLASEILMESDKELCAKARSEFKKNGGYNDGHIRTIQTQATLLEEFRLFDITKQHNINDYIIDIQGNRLLHLSSMVGNIQATRSLLSLEGTVVNIQNDMGETPLLLACKAGHAEIVKLLVDSGADASIVSDDIFSIGPLHWLFNFEADEIPDTGRLLVQKAKAQINHRATPLKEQVLHGVGYEYPYGQIQAWHFPYEWPYGTALHWSTFSRSDTAIDILCELGADIDAFDLESSDTALTPLSMAANRVDAEMVKHLLKKGASPIKIDQRGRGPLHFLSENMGRWSRGLLGWRGLRDWILCGTSAEHRVKVDRIVKLLLEAGCDLEGAAIHKSTREYFLTPLAYATMGWIMDANVVLSLIENRAKVDVPFPGETTLLQEWARTNPGYLVYPDIYSTVISTLVTNLSPELLQHQDPSGKTFIAEVMRNPWLPLHTVLQIVECYRASGCSLQILNLKDTLGYVPLHQAISGYQSKYKLAPLLQLLEALCLLGVDLTAISNDHQNSLHDLGNNEWLDDVPALHCLQLFKRNLPMQQFTTMITQQDVFGHTPLMLMAKFAKFECIKFLIEEGADTDIRCTAWAEQDWTVLDFALHGAERYRRWFLVDVHVYETLRSGVHNYTLKAQSRTDDLKEKFPKIFQYLRFKGAKRGCELGFKTGGAFEPRGFDQFALEKYKMSIETPEEWQFVYELKSRPPKRSPMALVRSFFGYLFGK